VPDGKSVVFEDGGLGRQRFVAGGDFGDFVAWRRDGVPAYELAVVVDDAAMGITEVVRGGDLLLSTARQILVYQALEQSCPMFHHTPLVRDGKGRRLAKRDRAASIGSLRQEGYSAEQVLAMARERTTPGSDERS
jgi:glutamyl-tRNA synthetase